MLYPHFKFFHVLRSFLLIPMQPAYARLAYANCMARAAHIDYLVDGYGRRGLVLSRDPTFQTFPDFGCTYWDLESPFDGLMAFTSQFTHAKHDGPSPS